MAFKGIGIMDTWEIIRRYHDGQKKELLPKRLVMIENRLENISNILRLIVSSLIRPFLSFGLIASMNDEAKVMFGSFDKTPYGEVDTIDMPESQPTKNPLRFKGNVCVLIDHNVGSAAVGFVGAIKDYRIASLIGEETGENTNGS
jgi:hypothetical protein